MAIASLDGTEVATLGFKLEGDEGFESGVEVSFPTVPIAGGLTAQRVASVRPSYAARKGGLTLFTEKTTIAALRTALDGLNAALAAPGTVLRSAINPSRRITVRLDGLMRIGTVGAQGAKYIGPYGWRATVPVIADDPFWTEEASATVTGISTTATALPCGTGPTWGDVDFVGPATNPVATLSDYNDVDRQTINPTITILSGDILRVSRTDGTVQKRVSGVWSDAFNVMPIGFDFLELRETWFRYNASDWCKVRVTSGTLSVTYPMRWK